MLRPIHVLIVDDSESDAKLVAHELRRAGIEAQSRRVDDAESMQDALDERRWDLVLSDWGMPRFNALAALRMAKEACPETPFVIVSGTIGEEAAVEAMRKGASDYVPKERMSPRLGAVVERELRERAGRVAFRDARNALRSSEARMARLAGSGIVGIAVMDLARGVIVESNDAFLSMIGRGRDVLDAGQLSWGSLCAPFAALEDTSALAALRDRGVLPLYEQDIFRADGKPVHALVGLALLEDGQALACVADLTERRRAEDALRRTEEQLRQAQKMEAIGNLAGGIAHDFNNLLTVIVGQAELMATDPALDAGIGEGLAEIQRAAERASDLTRRLLAFGRRQVMQLRVVSLAQLIGGMQSLFARLVGEDVAFNVVPDESPGYVRADPAQIEHVIMNLVINARDAMPRGGQITVETKNIDVDRDYIDKHGELSAGPYVMMSVTDTGVGMDRETQRRIFEPFFTTKESSRGTGLGLSMVFGIVHQSGGHIWLYSEPGHGTTFKLFFPRVTEAAVGASGSLRPRPRPISTRRVCTETILLAEDDIQVRSMLRTVLSGAGYRVLEASDGEQALATIANCTGRIHLLCTDVIMPNMNGRELASRVHALQPSIKTLFISGYPGSTMIKHGISEDQDTFLSKPLLPQALLQRIADVLDG